MRVTGTHHVALYTADLERLRAFYVETLGLPQVGAFPGGKILFIDAGSTAIELIARDGWAGTATGSWQHLAFEVESVDDAYDELRAGHHLPRRAEGRARGGTERPRRLLQGSGGEHSRTLPAARRALPTGQWLRPECCRRQGSRRCSLGTGA